MLACRPIKNVITFGDTKNSLMRQHISVNLRPVVALVMLGMPGFLSVRGSVWVIIT